MTTEIIKPPVLETAESEVARLQAELARLRGENEPQ
jgi:hypothetical protein